MALRCHIPTSPSSTGMFSASGASTKCRSISQAPVRNSPNRSSPTAIISGRPTAPQTEYRPPTQSQKPNTRSASIPKAAVLSSAVETAAKCFPAFSPSASRIHACAVRAFVIVSMVVKVFDATMTSVRAGSSLASVSAICAPSTFET